jgi:hypothetical protein
MHKPRGRARFVRISCDRQFHGFHASAFDRKMPNLEGPAVGGPQRPRRRRSPHLVIAQGREIHARVRESQCGYRPTVECRRPGERLKLIAACYQDNWKAQKCLEPVPR